MTDMMKPILDKIYDLCKGSDDAACVAYRSSPSRMCPHHESFEDGAYWMAEQLEVSG